MSYEAPYAGLKVIDVSQGVAGPYCAMMLAQYGADVIKVEPTDTGDWARGLGTKYGDHTAYSIPANVGKRSIALDLKQDAGRDVLWRLIQGADVFVQGFRPGVIDRLGFGYHAVAEREPRILYLSVSGFGQKGPLAERPAMDPVLQAYTGMMSENRGQDGIPHRIPFISIDMSTAIYSFSAVSRRHCSQRQHEPRGRHIENASLTCRLHAGLQVVPFDVRHIWRTARCGPAYRRAACIRPKMGSCRSRWCGRGSGRVTARRSINRRSAPVNNTGRPRDGSRMPGKSIRCCGRCSPPTQPRAWSAKFSAHRIMHEALNSYPAFLKQPHVAASGAVAWTHHPHVPQAIPLPNLIGMAPFQDGSPRTVAPSKGEHGVAIS